MNQLSHTQKDELIKELLGALKEMVELVGMCEYGGEPVGEGNYERAVQALAKAGEV